MNFKTLKDFEFPNMIYTQDNPKSLNGVEEMREKIKAAAIEDIKELRKNFKHGTFNFSCNVQDNLEEYIKLKFNIEENDILKSMPSTLH